MCLKVLKQARTINDHFEAFKNNLEHFARISILLTPTPIPQVCAEVTTFFDKISRLVSGIQEIAETKLCTKLAS